MGRFLPSVLPKMQQARPVNPGGLVDTAIEGWACCLLGNGDLYFSGIPDEDNLNADAAYRERERVRTCAIIFE